MQMDLTQQLQQHAGWRNGLFYALIAVVVIGFNWPGFMTLLATDPLQLGVTGLFYTFVYGLCYVHNRLCYERLFRTGRYGLYALSFLGLMLIWVVVSRLDRLNQPSSIANDLLSSLILLLFGWGLYLIYQYAFGANRQLRTALYSSRSEVAQLRAQMNPHFLFNALNNLYGVSISEPTRVPDYVLMLSDLLRYQIQSSQQERVSLHDELRFLGQFVHFERLRLGHRGEVGWQTDAPAAPDLDTSLAPMLLFPFLENAFKYGCQLARPVIRARVVVGPGTLHFTCENHYHPSRRAEKAGTQTGLHNTRLRLTLLYPQQHTLTITDRNAVFSVSLTLTLPPNAR